MKNSIDKFSKKNMIIAGASILVVGALFINGINNSSQEKISDNKANNNIKIENKIVVCDGVKVVSNCELEGVQYETYKYYPAVKEKSHIETNITYTKEIVDYCSLCNDGTYSPTCATGRGACSHHGGVAKKKSPRYRDVANHESITVIDSPAIPERYDKVLKKN